MRRVFFAALALLFSGCTMVVSAQNLLFLGTGSSGGSLVYVGPGDVVSGAIAWWGLRCYTATYTGNVARVKSPMDADTTTITCTGTNGTMSSTGTPLATTCMSSCTVDILYDQSGANSCGGAACDLVQTTEANRPPLIRSCQGGYNCLSVISDTQALCTSGTPISQVQPVTHSAVAIRTAVTGNGGVILVVDVTLLQQLAFFPAAADTVRMYAGMGFNATASDSTYHSLQFVYNGASSSINVNGSATTGDPGAASLMGQMCIGFLGNGNTDTIRVGELGSWGIAFNGTQVTNMTANQRGTWGF